MVKNNITTKQMSRQTKQNLYFFCIVALPILQFLIFYVYVNFDAVIMAFSKYELNAGVGTGFSKTLTLDNFAQAFEAIRKKPYLIGNSLTMFAVQLTVCYPLALLFSNYIYKKWWGAGFFKTVLFMPQLISGLVYGIIFSFLAGDCYTALTGDELGLLSLDRETLDIPRTTVILFNVIMNFGVNVLLFSGAMSNINVSIVESAHLDGANSIQEFIHITIPSIYGTFVQLFVVSIASIFTNQMCLMELYAGHAGGLATVGYFLFFEAKNSGLVPEMTSGVYELLYPALSALGVTITAIVVPITILLRKALYKFGPSVD